MANIKGNEKRHIQDEKRNLLNHMQMSALKTQIKKAQSTKKQEDLSKAYKMIDSALSKGIITKNKANRMKSRLSLYIAGKSNRTKIEKKQSTKKTTTASVKTASAKKVDKTTTKSTSKTMTKKAAKK